MRQTWCTPVPIPTPRPTGRELTTTIAKAAVYSIALSVFHIAVSASLQLRKFRKTATKATLDLVPLPRLLLGEATQWPLLLGGPLHLSRAEMRLPCQPHTAPSPSLPAGPLLWYVERVLSILPGSGRESPFRLQFFVVGMFPLAYEYAVRIMREASTGGRVAN